ncbi:hypothetical protein Goklo_021166 [Gossypium klotzschianum]|uniref:Retrovirus-related Pol polyprotein from transposon TNT 1-94 n=1 Tax=Gossypium klotzschianum TaxID=34286 RepID=A0A7J8UUK6_9ROSI|nr:hypothetical protein [Gossypium klotzschianum]
MEKTSSTLWKMLETLYATKSLANHLVFKQCVLTFRMNTCELFRDNISQFITLLNDLKNVEVKIDDEDQAMLLLCSPSSSYKSFMETLIYGKDKLSFKDVKGHLLSKDKLNNEFGSDSKTNSKEEDVAGANLANESGDDFLLISTSDSSELHMCPNKEWFSTYSPVEGGVVRM